MIAPIWIVVFDRIDGRQETIVRCDSPSYADDVIYHNTYYGRRCLKISVKAWKT